MTREEELETEKLESALKVIRVWAKTGELDCKKVLRLCNGVLPKLIHELPGVRRNRLTGSEI